MTRVQVGLISIALALMLGLAACSAFRTSHEDEEDRPPIIVRNGSIIFESGARGRPGKPWKKFQGVFFQDHPRGKPVTSFQLYFRGGTGDCAPVSGTDFSVVFDDDGNDGTDPKNYTVIIRAPGTGGGRPGLTLSGAGIDIDTSNEMRVHGGTTNVGKILSASVSTFTCNEPTEIYVESVK